MIGIIGAMESEIEVIKKELKDVKTEIISGMEFYIGCYLDKQIVLAKCNEGKVNAAMCTQTLILKYNPKFVINVGVAGAISNNLSVASVAIPSSTVEFDFDTTALGYELGYTFGVNEIYVNTDEELSNLIYKISKKVTKTQIGIIASSDKFVIKEEDKEVLKNNFNTIAVDMETASINHVCKLNDVKFTAIRVISDNSNNMEFREFLKLALEKLNLIMFEVLKEI